MCLVEDLLDHVLRLKIQGRVGWWWGDEIKSFALRWYVKVSIKCLNTDVR
jgi:hypothetical protein